MLKRKLSAGLLGFALGLPAALSLTVLAYGPDIEVEDERSPGLIPAFLVDHAGFRVDGPGSLSLRGLDAAAPIFPLYPVYKSKFLNKKFVGVMIPRKYLASEADHRAASAMMREVRMRDGLTLVPYSYKGMLFGIRSDVQVSYVNSTTVGISLSFGGPETVNLGDEFVLGLSLNIGAPKSNLGETRGLNLGESIQGVLTGVDLMFHGEDAEKLISRSLDFFPYIQAALAENGSRNLVLAEDSSARTEAAYAGSLKLPPTESPRLAAPVAPGHYSSELQASLGEIKDPGLLPKEVDWRSKLKPQVDATLVTAEASDQAFLQSLCDYLAQAYEVPREIWPRCRIAATLEPNAYAYPGGDVFFTAGLLGILSDLDSVLLVLGHEIGHVVGRHTTRRMPVLNTLMFSANALGIAGSIFSLGAGWGEVGSVTFLNWFPKSLAVSEVVGVSNGVLIKGGLAALMAHSRSAEWQADRFGQQAAFASGASMEAMASGWREFTDFFKEYFDLDDSLLARLMASHPNGDERHAKIVERASGFAVSLEVDHARNRLPPSYYSEYRKIHDSYHPMVQRFGMRKGNKNRSKAAEARLAQYSLETLTLPGGQCVLHSLGAMD